jgi:hypothetical protein
VADENSEVVARLTKLADEKRQILGDNLKGIEGCEVRPKR